MIVIDVFVLDLLFLLDRLLDGRAPLHVRPAESTIRRDLHLVGRLLGLLVLLLPAHFLLIVGSSGLLTFLGRLLLLILVFLRYHTSTSSLTPLGLSL